jgi:hypothetical protein
MPSGQQRTSAAALRGNLGIAERARPILQGIVIKFSEASHLSFRLLLLPPPLSSPSGLNIPFVAMDDRRVQFTHRTPVPE